MSSAMRIGKDLELIRTESFAERCRISSTAFTRRRKMPINLLIDSLIARKGRTLKMELWEFARETNAPCPISVPGYLKQREKLNPLALLDLALHHAHCIYDDEDYTSYEEMLLISIDGSTANVPTNDATIERYGNASSHGKDQAVLGISAAYDVLNRQIVSATINRGGFDERAQVYKHLEVLPDVIGKRPFALIMDRGYPSFSLMADLHDANIMYIMRCQSNFMNAEFRQASEAGGDLEVDVEMSYARLQTIKRTNESSYEALKDRPPFPVRCALVDIGGTKPEKIITNIPIDLLSADQLKEIYHMRWGVETCFQMLKDKLQMENFTGTRPLLIEQDIYASIYVLNVAFDMANDADATIQKSNERSSYIHEMTINRGFAIGLLKEEAIHLILADDDERERIMDSIINELGRHLVPIRPERHYSREGLNHHRANKYNNTHKRVI